MTQLSIISEFSHELSQAREFIAFLRRIKTTSYRAGTGGLLAHWWDHYDDDDHERFSKVVERISGFLPYWCDSCDAPVWHWAWHGQVSYAIQQDVCDSCLENEYVYCEECGEYFDRDDDHDHPEEQEGSWCEVEHQSFEFPVIGSETGRIANDTRLAVEMAGGTISKEGIREIIDYLIPDHWNDSTVSHSKLAHDFDFTWQTRDGNLTKRLAK